MRLVGLHWGVKQVVDGDGARAVLDFWTDDEVNLASVEFYPEQAVLLGEALVRKGEALAIEFPS